MWTSTDLFSGSQPITAQPKAAYGEAGVMMVYFGTGWYLEPTDILDLSPQSFYCVIDRHDGATNPSLVNQTSKVRDIGNADGLLVYQATVISARQTMEEGRFYERRIDDPPLMAPPDLVR